MSILDEEIGVKIVDIDSLQNDGIRRPSALVPSLALTFSILSLLVTPAVVWANYMLLEQGDPSLEQIEERLFVAPYLYFAFITISVCCGSYSLVKHSGRRVHLILSVLSLVVVVFSLVSFGSYMILLLDSI